MKRFALACGLALATVGSAQQPPEVKPGPEHEVLKGMVGTWAGKMKMQGQENDVRCVYRMECGGLWLTRLGADCVGPVAMGRGTPPHRDSMAANSTAAG